MKRFSILFLIVLVMGISPAFAENNLDETSRREIESILEESIFQDKNKEEAQNMDMKTRVYVEMYDDKGTDYMEWVPLQLDVAWLLDNKPDKILAAFRWTDSEGTQWAVTYNKTNFWLTKFPPDSFTCILKFTLYDHFGLNKEDLFAPGWKNFLKQSLAGFRSWFFLQHYNRFDGRFKPFITEMTFTVPLAGVLHDNN